MPESPCYYDGDTQEGGQYKWWGNNGDGARKYAIAWCSDQGYTDASTSSRCRDDSVYSLKASCLNHGLDKEHHTWSRVFSDSHASKLGKGDRNAAALSDCQAKGFNGINKDEYHAVDNFNQTYKIRCSDPKTTMPDLNGRPVKCINDGDSKVYRLENGNTLRHYPDGEIANSWDPNWANDINDRVCSGLKKGAPMAKKVIDEELSPFKYRGNNGSVSGDVYCQGKWESLDPTKDKNLLCVGGIDKDNGTLVGCSEKYGKPLYYNCFGQMKGTDIVFKPKTVEDTTVEDTTVEDTTVEDTTVEDTTVEDTPTSKVTRKLSTQAIISIVILAIILLMILLLIFR